MKKKVLIGIVIGMIILCCFYLIYNCNSFEDMRGNYSSVDSNSAYSLSVSKTGTFSIVDVGVGNPVMKGHLFKVPFADACVICCLGDEDFDGTFLNVKSPVKYINYFPQQLGREMDQPFMSIVFENGNDHIQFNEIDWLDTNRQIWE